MHTLTELFTAYLADTLLNHEPSTHRQQTLFFAAVLRDLGPLALDVVTSDVLRAWKGRLSVRHKPATVYRYMMFLGAALRYGVECGWLLEDPLRRIRKPSPGRGHVRFLTTTERQRLLLACRMSRQALLYPVVVLALATGGRKEELRLLRWPEVDFGQGVVRFLKTKTHEPRSVPLLGEARTLLEQLAQRRRPSDMYVFARPDGRQPVEIDSAWRTARTLADLKNFRFHDLRHTFASYCAMSGASLREIADVLGHAKIAMTMTYSHLLESHSKGVVERMMRKFMEEN
jgi:integrase